MRLRFVGGAECGISRHAIEYSVLNFKELPIRRADVSYQLSKKHHPDAPSGSTAKFHEINDAYAILGDDSKR